MFTDSHCHLTFPQLAEQLPAIRAAMRALGITLIEHGNDFQEAREHAM